MGATTSKFGLRYPALSDAPNVPQDIANLANDIDTKLAGPMPIARTELAAAAATVSFASIPQTFNHLLVVGQCRVDAAVTFSDVTMRFNDDAGNNYSSATIRYDGTSLTNNTSFGTGWARFLGIAAGASAPAADTGIFEILVPNYSKAGGVDKAMFGRAQWLSLALPNLLAGTRYGRWASNVAITSVSFFSASGGNFLTGSIFELYGMS